MAQWADHGEQPGISVDQTATIVRGSTLNDNSCPDECHVLPSGLKFIDPKVQKK